MMSKNDKKNPSQCKIEVECRATASLQEEVQADLKQEDKPLEEILDTDNAAHKTTSITTNR